jgi:RinA family phage transcriptional activator
MKVRREIKAYIECELRDYNQTLKYVIEERDIVPMGSFTKKNISTEVEIFKFITNKRLHRMEHTVKAIKMVIAELPKEKCKLIELRYWTRPRIINDIGICQKLNISTTTYYRWVDEILFKMGVELGLINEVKMV